MAQASELQALFDKHGGRARRLLRINNLKTKMIRRFINWLRWKFLKKRLMVGCDYGDRDSGTWCLIEHNARRGTFTVLDEGTFNDKHTQNTRQSSASEAS